MLTSDARLSGAAIPLRTLSLLAAAFIAIVALARYTPLDRLLTQFFYDPASRQFPLREEPLWALVLHSGLKNASLLGWFALLGYWIALKRRSAPAALRRGIGFTLLAAAMAALAVSVARSFSAHSCPWDLRLYGGSADYFRFFDLLPPNPGPGRCAPSGHAASGFVWFAGFFGLRRVSPPLARGFLVAALTLGLLAGLTQLARGAHFISHVLLTAWICFTVAWALDALRRGLARHRQATPVSQ